MTDAPPLTVRLHIWRLDAEQADEARLAAHLSADETARAARFVQDRDRRRFRVARGRLRELLARHAGGDARELRFAYGPQGKPALPGGPSFNLTHSGGVAALALHEDLPLGLDIEAERPVEAAVARHFFSTAEQADMARLSGADWIAGFYRCWTRKEAVVKALGGGLSIPLSDFDVSLLPGVPSRLLRLSPEHGEAEDWTLVHLDLGPGLPGALALPARGRRVAVEVAEAPEGMTVEAS